MQKEAAGNLTFAKISEMIRVNHAGEMGAKVIYEGQIAALKLKKDTKTLKLVEEMKAQEIEHFNFFDAEIVKRGIRPTLMQPVWQIGGFALGFLTAIIDKKSAMLCTAAVEEVIDEHYQAQIDDLKAHENGQESEEKSDLKTLCSKIEKFRDEEIEHRNTAYKHQARDFYAFRPLSSFIKVTTKLAIAVSKKI